ncbi:hypothetical protein E2C01_085150 [Portunus trituberculatus]|uniref:Uncharacterized protein n=1 Tax=Portunus trituberculatus TaxID=210409 RepID=A0A5B7J9N9_PORTR|nr:hypothetical protein [Portunus trituberculatus]
MEKKYSASNSALIYWDFDLACPGGVRAAAEVRVLGKENGNKTSENEGTGDVPVVPLDFT